MAGLRQEGALPAVAEAPIQRRAEWDQERAKVALPGPFGEAVPMPCISFLIFPHPAFSPLQPIR